MLFKRGRCAMTASDFNRKYSKYLEPRFYGCALEDEKALKVLDWAFETWKNYEGFSYSQIKMKFNFCCIYCTGVPQEEISSVANTITEIYGTKKEEPN